MRLLTVLFSFLAFTSFSQEDTLVCENPDREPEFPGGMSKLMQWITSQEIQYEEGLLNGTCSKIYLQFIVERDGSISNVKSLRTCALSQENAVKFMQNSPNWSPAILNSVTVRSRYNLPMTICLE